MDSSSPDPTSLALRALAAPLGPELLGPATVWVAAGGAALLTILVVVAFVQGREISFWHPRIGPRPPARDQVGVAALSCEGFGPTARPTDDGVVGLPAHGRPGTAAPASDGDRTAYEVRQAIEFYQAIASRYDQRNSGPLLATQREVVRRISARLEESPSLRVLDLGGGTGRDIATHFFDHDRVRWTYVDAAAAMADQFRRNIEDTRLGATATLYVEKLESVVARTRPGTFDVIVLSFVLSSMARWPDVGSVAHLLAPGGVLIVADIDPTYAVRHPYYEVTVGGTTHALQARLMRPVRILADAMTAGLTSHEVVDVPTRHGDAYAFVLVLGRLEPPASVGGDSSGS